MTRVITQHAVRALAAGLAVLGSTSATAGAQDTVVVRDTIPIRKEPPAPPVPVVTERAGVVRVCGGGDVTLGNNLDPAWAARAARNLADRWGRSPEPLSLLAPLVPLVADADIVMLNVESAIGEGPFLRKCGPGSTSCFAFRSPLEAAPALRAVAPDASVVGNIANNHARDAGPAGFVATRRHLERAGVSVTGADTLATPVVTENGDTVAFLGFYTSAESPDARDLAAVRRHVARAKRRWPVVIVTTHMGAEGIAAQRTRDAKEIFLGRIDRGNPVAFARTAIDAGASVVFGHGPHVLRAAEWHGDRIAFHSLGNLLTYGPFSNGEPINRGAVACVVLGPDGGVREAAVRSTQQLAPGVLVADTRHRAAFLMDSLGRLDFPRNGVRFDRQGRAMIPHAVPDLPVLVDSLRVFLDSASRTLPVDVTPRPVRPGSMPVLPDSLPRSRRDSVARDRRRPGA